MRSIEKKIEEENFTYIDLIEEEIEKERDDIKINRYDIKISLVQPSIKTLMEDLDTGEIYIPDFQRNFRWSQEKASKLIESFLLGLPVPPIFVYSDSKERKVVIDGQQRLLSLYLFIRKGKFPRNTLNLSNIQGLKELEFEGREFKLVGVKQEWENKTFKELKEEDKRYLLNAPIWIINVWQIKPEQDLSSVFYIFERLNTGGELLSPMEIRRAIYYGNFYKCLEELNLNEEWRKLLGKKQPDKKLMDIEILLRILYLSESWKNYREPMKERLNEFMKVKKDLPLEELEKLKRRVQELFKLIYRSLVTKAEEEKPFSLKGRRLNISFLDSFLSLSLKYLDQLDETKVINIYKTLKNSDQFKQIIEKYRVSTDEKGIKERFNFVKEVIEGVLNK
jgi:hypothetical protein